MNISDCKLYFYTLPLKRRVVIGDRSMEERNGWLIRLCLENGVIGWGEAAPLPGISSERPHTLGHELFTLKSMLVGREFSDRLLDFNAIKDAVPSVRCAFEMAFWNAGFLSGYASRFPYAERDVAGLHLNGLLAGQENEILDRAAGLAESGCETVKIKVGRRPISHEASLVRRIDDMMDGNVRWRLDANKAWTYQEAVEFMTNLDGLEIEYIEEPLEDTGRLVEWSNETGAPVALDESLMDIGPDELSDFESIKAIVLKPMLLGGFSRCMSFMDAAGDIGVYPVISSMFESGIGIRTLAHFATCSPAGHHPAGLDTYDLFEKDLLIKPLKTSGKYINMESVMSDYISIDHEFVREIENDDGYMPFT